MGPRPQHHEAFWPQHAEAERGEYPQRQVRVRTAGGHHERIPERLCGWNRLLVLFLTPPWTCREDAMKTESSIGPKVRPGRFKGRVELWTVCFALLGCAQEQRSIPPARLPEGQPAAAIDSAPATPPAHRLENAQPSARHLAELVLVGIKEKDASLLHSLRVTEREYRTYLFPEFASPGNPVDLNWQLVEWHSLAGVGKALQAFGGEDLELVDVIATGGVEDYRTFKLLNNVVLQVRKKGQPVRQLRLFGSIV